MPPVENAFLLGRCYVSLQPALTGFAQFRLKVFVFPLLKDMYRHSDGVSFVYSFISGISSSTIYKEETVDVCASFK